MKIGLWNWTNCFCDLIQRTFWNIYKSGFLEPPKKKMFVRKWKKKTFVRKYLGTLLHGRSTVTLKLQKFQNNSPHNLGEHLACLNSLKRAYFISVKVRVRLVLQVVIPRCLEARQNGGAFAYAVPPRMEEVRDRRHILIGSCSD